MEKIIFCLFWLGLTFTCKAQNVDNTLVRFAKGPDVIQAVVDKIRSNCIYADDRLFLRRLAYIESEDGLDPKTFRPGYHGGIWQVSKKNYESTRNCDNLADISDMCNKIESAFHIKWENTTWDDLTKPLYSGLAASLYLHVMAGNSTPGQIDKQASFWKQYYSPNATTADFISRLSSLDNARCSDSKPIDVVFVVDSSASIGLGNFIQMKQFLENVTDSLNVGPDAVHIGMVSFEYYSQIEFFLDEHSSNAEVKSAIRKVQYLYGATNIAQGIKKAHQQVFREAKGARKDAVKIMILLTDGQSNILTTYLAAQDAKADGIVIFVIGIGDVDINELNAAASEPDCTHVFILSDFTEIGSLLYEIQKSACRSQQIIDLNTSNNTNSSSPYVTTNHTLTLNTTQNTIAVYPDVNSLKNDTNMSTVGIVTKVHCGIVKIYASYNTPHPGPAIHDIQSTASDGNPSVLYLNSSRDGKPLYITYVGTKLPESADNLHKCVDASYSVTFTDGKPKGVDVVCRDDSGERECTKTDLLLNPTYSQWFCSTDKKEKIQNPCTTKAVESNSLYHPYPLDDTKFIRCDLQGKMYVTLCPEGERYHQASHSCGTVSETIDVDKVPLDPDLPNPCTRSAILANNLFFRYSRDAKKFVHCDVWGHAWILDCPTGQVWTQVAHTCTHDSLNQGGNSASVTNPCTKEALQMGHFFFPLPDKTKFIHCDISGNAFVQSCNVNHVFDPAASVCVPDQINIVG